MGHSVTKNSSPEDKIMLFRSLFRGRDDVYPKRFESQKSGKIGYSPACANEWARGLCDKRKTKCVTCPNRRFIPVTNETIRWHLSGTDTAGREFVAGVYPMLIDETCYFLAVDFDKKSWMDDVAAFRKASQDIGIPCVIERSRSGNGAHAWIFFESPIPAILARKLGTHIITITMERHPDMGLDSYDRLFPNQDTLPKGGLGNLIALPLQRKARDKGNTVFVDDNMEPWCDQWDFLSGVDIICKDRIATVVSKAERNSNIVGVRLFDDEDGDDAEAPWAAHPSRWHAKAKACDQYPKEIEIVLGNDIYICKEQLTPFLQNSLLRLAAFQNPAFYKAQAMRLPTFDKPRVIACATDHPQHWGLPRGCLEDVQSFLDALKIRTLIRDERFAGHSLHLGFSGKLRPEQKEAAAALVAHNTGVLAAATAFGKTVLAAWIISHRATNTLILVHRRQLLEQWIERLTAFLDIPAKEIGRIGGGKRKPTGRLDVALIQSLVRKGTVQSIVGEYGHLVVDECHHLPAFSFEQVARQAKAKYVLGLSATVTRKDGHHPIIFMQCGPIRHHVHAKKQAEQRAFSHSVLVQPTSFRWQETEENNTGIIFHKMYQALMFDSTRNRQIVSDIVKSVQEGRKPIVLTERREHVDILSEVLASQVEHLIILKGGMSKRNLDASMQALRSIPESEGRVLLATGRYLGEGFDDARLDTLFLTLPVSWRGTIAQYVGRLHRSHIHKHEVRVYDYADLNVPMLARMFDRRCKGYESVGYTILLPASAVPGWPVDVPLPVELEWKHDYAASVQRLIRDGVDQTLGNLFVHAAQLFPITIEGGAIARSSSEAFLYRRLETLPATAGKFGLNQKLPIPFDQRGYLEVDFLCPEARIVVEIDGAQHFSDVEAYRRDRRKDALLQERGYFVLRFLAEDIGKELNAVLDTILRTLAHCKNKQTKTHGASGP